MKWCCTLAATVLLVGCPSSPQVPRAPSDTALRIRIAQAEARRSGGVGDLIELAIDRDPHTRALARRALGRIGTEPAIEALKHGINDHDAEGAAAAIAAIGVVGSLDDLGARETSALTDAVVIGVVSEGMVGHERGVLVAIEALGRAGNQKSQETLVTELRSSMPAVAEASAIALARHGRRKIELTADARAALVKATQHLDRSVRYAAVYALGREQLAKPASGENVSPHDQKVEPALAARVTDEDPETRAQAIAGLAKRGAIDVGRKAIEDSLRDRDWRVAVEAVRALAGEHGDDAGRDATSAALLRRWAELVRGHAAEAHVITEGLRLLVGHADRPLVVAALTALATSAAIDQSIPALTRGWIECLAIAGIARVSPQPEIDAIAKCGHDNLPDHLRLPLLADFVKAGAGDASKRRAALRILLAHADPRARAAGLGALAATWKDGDATDHAMLVGTLTSALGAKDPMVAGSAVDTAPAIYDAIGTGPEHAGLDAAVITRAHSEHDVELSASLYELIGKRVIASGADACRSGLTGAPARAHAAAECLRALGEPAPVATPAPAEAPPIDVASVINQSLRWHLVTTRGEIVIDLRPDVAPWNVATIVALTRKGFYDGLELHRVVPNFVAQGGDPTMSGWGGPGFTTPAEPGSALDGSGFDVGGVGIADAGRDSGGSQWFIMHSRAAHLDGRYTWIGTVASGQKSADALLIGDRVVKATIEMR